MNTVCILSYLVLVSLSSVLWFSLCDLSMFLYTAKYFTLLMVLLIVFELIIASL